MNIKIQKTLTTSQLMDEIEIAICWAEYHGDQSRARRLNELWEELNSFPSDSIEQAILHLEERKSHEP